MVVACPAACASTAGARTSRSMSGAGYAGLITAAHQDSTPAMVSIACAADRQAPPYVPSLSWSCMTWLQFRSRADNLTRK